MKDVDGAGSTYHLGESTVQARAGTRLHAEAVGARAFRNYMTDQHRAFFAQLPFIVAAAVDSERQPWISLLAGPPGFVTTPNSQSLEIALRIVPGDPLQDSLVAGRQLGLLGIEQHTRRRNRLNGFIKTASSERIEVGVRQSFGNCPKYIQAREVRYSPSFLSEGISRYSDGLDAGARAMIAAADTFFIASAHPSASETGDTAQGVDASHRGGRPGFVVVREDGSLFVPDYSGNGFFNTLGNLQLNPLAGLLFVDFASGNMLHVCVDARIVWEGPELSAAPGADRALCLRPRQTLFRERALPLHWGPVTPSHYLAAANA